MVFIDELDQKTSLRRRVLLGTKQRLDDAENIRRALIQACAETSVPSVPSARSRWRARVKRAFGFLFCVFGARGTNCVQNQLLFTALYELLVAELWCEAVSEPPTRVSVSSFQSQIHETDSLLETGSPS